MNYILTIIEPYSLAGTWALKNAPIISSDTMIAKISETKYQLGVEASSVTNEKYFMIKTRHSGVSLSETNNFPVNVVVYSIDGKKIEELKSKTLLEAGQSGIIKSALGIGELSQE